VLVYTYVNTLIACVTHLHILHEPFPCCMRQRWLLLKHVHPLHEGIDSMCSLPLSYILPVCAHHLL
jgi:hypothetical protein